MVERSGARQATVMTSDDASDTLWDANDVARYLKVSRSWVYHRAEAGLLPYLRVGALLRFEPAAVRAYVREHGGR
jgi:excisionase family DNA binding protein